MYAEINPNSLLKALQPVTQLVDEAKLHVSESGIHTKAVDPANVGMVEMHLDREEFETLKTDNLVLGVDLNTFLNQIQDISDEPVGDEEQTLHLELDEDTRKVRIWATPGSMEFTMALIDPDSIRQEPNLPDMELPGTMQVMSSYFEHAVKTAKNYSEHITVGMDNEKDVFYMSANGDTDDWETMLKHDHHAISHLETATVNSIFSLDYFDDVRKGIPSDVMIDMEVGEEFPIRIMFEFLDENASVTYMIAPRIESDD